LYFGAMVVVIGVVVVVVKLNVGLVCLYPLYFGAMVVVGTIIGLVCGA
jgi:hypothetical protein